MQTNPDLEKKVVEYNNSSMERVGVVDSQAQAHIKDVLNDDIEGVVVSEVQESSDSVNGDMSRAVERNFEFSGDTGISALYWIMSLVKAHPNNYLIELKKTDNELNLPIDKLYSVDATAKYWKESLSFQKEKLMDGFKKRFSIVMTGFVSITAFMGFASIILSVLVGPFPKAVEVLVALISCGLFVAFGGFLGVFLKDLSESSKLIDSLEARVKDVAEREVKNSSSYNFEFDFPAFKDYDYSFLKRNNCYFSIKRVSDSRYNYADISLYRSFNISPFIPLIYQREEVKDVVTWGYKIYQELFIDYFKKGYLDKNGQAIKENIPENMLWRVMGVSLLNELFQKNYSFTYASMFFKSAKYKKLLTSIFVVIEVILVDSLSTGGALSGRLGDVLKELEEHNEKYLNKPELNGDIKDNDNNNYEKILPIMKNSHLLDEKNLNKRRDRILNSWANSCDDNYITKFKEGTDNKKEQDSNQ